MLNQGAEPSVAGLYMETFALLQAGLEEAEAAHGAVGWAGTLEIWFDMLPHLFTTSDSCRTLPSPRVETMPNLCGVQLQKDWVATPRGQLCTILMRQPTPNCLSANWVAYIHCLLEVLAPPNHQLWVGSCPYC